MAKLTRKTLLQFGSTVNAASEIGQFGSYASPVYTADIATLQAGTAWPRGWAAETVATNRPFLEDMNAIDVVFGYMLSYILQMGIAEYDAGTTYYTDSYCQIAGQIYQSLTDNNTGNAPASSPSDWRPGIGSKNTEVSGVIKQYAGTIAPTGYLICDGSAISRATYASLFAICSTTFGAGDGSTTFNIPDLRTRIPVGYKSGDADFGTLGGTLGEKTHTLTVAEIPDHHHTINTYDDNIGSGNQVRGAAANNPIGSVTGGVVGSTGGTHNNIQPSIVLNYIIKT